MVASGQCGFLDSGGDVVVRARGLVKRYGAFVAVDGVDIDIRRGEIFGFLGPNGAGKTTTIRMLTMLSPASEGTVEVDGREVTGLSDPVKERIGIVQQHIALDRDVTVRENIRYHTILHRMPRRIADERIGSLVEMMGLGPYMDRLVINLSGGWKRRAAIVCAIVHEPELLLLDEPVTGLDPIMTGELYHIFKDCIEKYGVTVIMVSHDIRGTLGQANRILHLSGGTQQFFGTTEEYLRSPVGQRFAGGGL